MKHCGTCEHLDYYEGNVFAGEGPNGYSCNKRQYRTEAEESRHLRQLEDEQYKLRPKRCFEPRENRDDGV